MAVMFRKDGDGGRGADLRLAGAWTCAATSWSKRSSATAAAKAIFAWPRRNGIIDSYFLRGEEFPAGVDFLMMGTPVETIVPLTKTFLPKLEPGCIISDVGSVKGEIVRGMERLLPKDIYFVAGHPIAGSEQWGAQAARRDLFVRHRCILTPTTKTDRQGAGKNRRALAQGRRRCRDHASTTRTIVCSA